MSNKGFAGQEKLGEQQHATVAPMGSTGHAIDVAPKQLFPTSLIPITPVSATYTKGEVVNGLPTNSRQVIELTASGAREGDVLRFDTGPLVNMEIPVIGIDPVNSDLLEISMKISNADAIASTCLLMRHITLTLAADGSLVTTSGPIQYILDAAAEEVEEDTAVPANNRGLPTQTFVDVDGIQEPLVIDTATPANNVALPSQMFITRDGITEPVTKDTVTPANTIPIPMELVSTNGVEATINVTTGDLHVEISHDGATHTYDSTRIGDGTNEMAVNASLQAEVHDTDNIVQTTAINTVVGLQTDAAETDHTQSDTLMAFTKGMVENQATAQTRLDLLATEAKQDTLQTKVDTLSTEAKQDDVITALGLITSSTADKTATEDFYRRDFTGSPLTTASSFQTLVTLTASIKKMNITNNSGNELVIRNGVGGKQIIVGQGVAFSQALTGIATDVIQIAAITADAVDGIIYVNFEG